MCLVSIELRLAYWNYKDTFWAILFIFFFSSRRRHTRWPRDWSSDVVLFRSSGRPAQRSGLGRAETRSISAEPDVRPEPAPVVQRGAVAPGPQAVHEVATPVQVGLVDPRAVEEGPVDVRPEAEAKGKAEPIRRVEDRVVADERIVEKRIVARAVKAVVVRPTPAIAITEAHRRRIVRVVV